MLERLEGELEREGRDRDGFIIDARTPTLPTKDMLAQYEQFGLDGVRIHASDLAGLQLHECSVEAVINGLKRWSDNVLQRA